MEIEGMITHDLGLQEGTSARTGNIWKKHQWLLETFGQFPRKVKFDVFGEKATTMLFEPGKYYAVAVDVESREFNGKWYTDVKAYSARPIDGPSQPGFPQGAQFGQQPAAPSNPYASAQPFGAPAPSANPFATPEPQQPAMGASDEDLPF